MTVQWQEAQDRDELARRMAAEKRAVQRDRCRVVLLAGEGQDGAEVTREQIAATVGRSRQFVDAWVGRYRRAGLNGLQARKQPARKPKLSDQQVEQLKARLDGGPRDADGVCVFHGKDICRLIEKEFGVVHTLGGKGWCRPQPQDLTCLRNCAPSKGKVARGPLTFPVPAIADTTGRPHQLSSLRSGPQGDPPEPYAPRI
jgi:transposase